MVQPLDYSFQIHIKEEKAKGADGDAPGSGCVTALLN